MIGGLMAFNIILSKRQPIEPVTYIYFLFQGDTLVYIGSSISPHTRMREHRRKFHFDSYTAIPCKVSEQKTLETAYILAYAPILNGSLPDKQVAALVLSESENDERRKNAHKRKAKHRDYFTKQYIGKEALRLSESGINETCRNNWRKDLNY